MKPSILFLFCISNFLACKSGQNSNINSELHKDYFQLDSLLLKSDLAPDSSYSEVKIIYPKSIGDNSETYEKMKMRLIQSQCSYLFHAINPEEQEVSSKLDLRALAQSFIKAYPTSETYNDMSMIYTHEGLVDTIFHNSKSSSFWSQAYSYLGGAHPNTFIDLLNFDTNTGELIDLKSIVSDTSKFKAIVLNAFEKKETAIAKEENFEYNMNDYFFGSGFQLPKNFAITKEGLFCLYNSYEAAPYARGPISFTIPWQDINNIINTKYRP